MRILVVALVFVVAGLAARAPVFQDIPVAQACSCPDCDAVRDSDVIVGGRILGWSESKIESPLGRGYIPIDVDLAVDQVFKGWAPSNVPVVDFASLWSTAAPGTPPMAGPLKWSGAGGACGAFDEDPDGKYVILGFGAHDTPHPWQANRMRVLFLGPGPAGRQYQSVVEGLSVRLGAPYPPSVGDSPPAAPAESSNDWMFVSAIGGGCLLITLVLLLAGPKREPRDGSRRSSGRAEKVD